MKQLLFGIFCFWAWGVWAQEEAPTKLIEILNSDDLMYEITGGREIQRLKGNVAILHDGTYFYCDSAIHDVGANTFRAFSKVRVEMPNQVTLTSNKLDYDGNTRIGDAVGKAVVTDGKATLSSEKLTYHRNENFGYYTTGGKLVNDNNTLTSKFGYYYPDPKMAYFKQNVKLVSPDYTLTTDTLGYNTETKTAQFITLTKIENEDGTFTTTEGSYDTQNKKLVTDTRTQVVNKDYFMEADRTDYNNESKLATMLGNVYIRQKDTSVTIFADSARYNRETGKGSVFGNVKMIQKDSSVITAVWAKFDKEKKTANAYENVIIRQKDSSSVIFADSAFFDNEKKEGDVFNNVRIFQKDSSYSVYADAGHFYNESSSGYAYGNVEIYQKDSSYTIYADTTYFYKNSDKGTANGHVKITQKDSSITIWGGEAIFYRDTKETYITRNPLSLQRLDKDSLYVIADTLYAVEDTAKRRTFKAYHHVSIYLKDLQSRADSMVYLYSDSMILLFQKPILWSDSTQLSGDTVKIWMRNKKVDSLWVNGQSFLASQADSIGFNQIKGREFRAKFRENKLSRLHVLGNSQSIYFIKDEKKGYQGMNQSTSQEMYIHLKDNKANRIVFVAKPETDYKPMHEVMFQENRLEGMDWRYKEKPEKPELPE